MVNKSFGVLFILIGIITSQQRASSATLPSGFTEQQAATGLLSPTAMEFAPDGRLFVCEQGGTLRVIKNDILLARPFLSVPVDNSSERGLLGITFDPNFLSNGYLYVYYTATSPAVHNRVSRFTASGDTALPGSELILLNLPNLVASNHNGGAMHFGIDGKLYIAVGENGNPPNAQDMTTTLGKMLRMNSDGTIPTDNPFYATATGNNRLIWALGVRNPFTFIFKPGTSTMYINDVGQSAWEEIDNGVAGSNYGWPVTEGFSSDPSYVNPMFAYPHSGVIDQSGCAITGGAFYNPVTAQFPPSYTGEYFFADYCNGWIRKFHPADSTATTFATGISSPVDLKTSTDGSLYYLARGTGSNTGMVTKIIYSSSFAPAITVQPLDQTISTGHPVTFTVSASGGLPLSYQWQRNTANITGATSAVYTIASVQLSDNNAMFRCVVTNAFGTATSNSARLTATSNQPPVAAITLPGKGSLYSDGDTITYAGTGTDPEQGILSGSAFTWQVDFQHNTHKHPFIPPTSGSSGGSFVIPSTGETSDTVWYRIYLTVTDTGGLTRTDTTEIFPRKSTVTIATNPTGLQILLDGIPRVSPYSFVGVVGMQRSIEAVNPQSKSGQSFFYSSWSDGGSAAHTITTPVTNQTFTASFLFSPPSPNLITPANGAANQPPSLNFSWNSAAAAVNYRFQLATDSLFVTKIVDDSTLTDTTRAVGGLVSAMTYYWHVNAKNSLGISSWSQLRRFSTTDLITPSVSISSPLNGSPVSGSITVSANASDNVAVAGVQFKLDGALLGAEDTTAPYSISWNTNPVSNGLHILTALVRDAAGNSTTSAPDSVTVSNTGSSSDLWVYQEALTSPWINASWAGTFTFNSTEQSFTPPNSIKCVTGSFGGFRIRSAQWGTTLNINPALYTRLEFLIYNTTAGLSLNISFSNDAGGVFPAITYANVPVNQWITVSYPMAQMDPTGLPIQYIAMQSNSSTARTFFIDNLRFVGSQSAPSAPLLASPANGAVNQPLSLSFRWRSSAGATSYRFQLAGDSLFTSKIVDDSTLTDTTRPVSSLLNLTKYFWRVNAKNSTGTSAFSQIWNMTTAPAIPAAPILVSPPNAAVSQPSSLTFRWNSATGASTYRIQLATDSLFISRIVDDSTLTDTTRPVTSLFSSTRYFWRVSAKNSTGTSSFSQTWNLTTSPLPPSPPILLSPANAAVNQPTSLTFRWNSASGASSYRIQLATDSLFTSKIVDDSTLTDTTRPVTSLLNLTKYFWRVNAKNTTGTSSFSQIWNMTTSPAIPATPVLLSPSNASVNQPSSLTFRWNSASGASTYRIQLAADSLFTSKIVDDSTLTDTTRPVTSLLNLTKYFWRVSAKNITGTSSFSQTWNLTTSPLPPSTPVLLSPANAAANQPTSLTFRWNSASGASTYRIQLATDSLFISRIVDDSTLTDTTRAVSSLASSTTYYWHVNAKNSVGVSSWSQLRRFSTVDLIAPTVSMSAPLNGAVVSGSITVSANASDNIAVVGVQFRLDGALLGAEDTTAPYNTNWNTIPVSNGLHILTAIARDAAGNSTTSAPDSVTVSNVASSDLWVYQEALTSPWIDASWAGTFTLNSTEQSFTPPNSIKCVTGSFGGFRVRSAQWGTTLNINPALYNRLEFLIYNTTAGLSLNISFSNDAGSVFPSVAYANVPVNQWITVSYTMAQMDPGNLPIQYIAMQSNSSSARTFFIDNLRFVGSQSAPPTTPLLTSPANGAVNQPLSLSFRWRASAGATSYRFQLAGDSLFTAKLVDDSTLTDTTRPVTSLLNLTKYFWRVNAKNSTGTSSFSQIWNMTTTPAIPATPTLLSPANAAVNQPTSLTFRWNSASGAASYRIQLATDSLFVSKVVDDSTLTDTTRAVSGLSSSTMFYWHVNAKNSNGVTSWSSMRRFSTTDLIAPTVSMSAPLNGSLVSSSVTVSANAADNIAVVGVQFRLDGVSLGAEDTTAPYSISWNTIPVSNGLHILTAIARDAAGNSTTSAPDSVNVSNSGSSSDLWVYQEALATPWINASWAGTFTFNSTEQSFTPPNSIKCVMGSFGALRLRNAQWGTNAPISAASYTRFEFVIYNTTAGLSLNISFSNDAGGVFPAITYANVPVNQWITVSYTMSQMNPANLPIQYIAMQSNSSAARTFYVDNMRLVGVSQGIGTDLTVGESDAGGASPSQFGLGNNFPNPFNPLTTLTYALPVNARVTLKVYDVLGREVASLVDDRRQAGTYSVQWDAGSFPSGNYFARLQAIDEQSGIPFTQVRRLLLVK